VSYTIQQLSAALHAKLILSHSANIEHLLIDSRKVSFEKTSLFFALKSSRRDGHCFIEDVYQRGVTNFVVDTHFNYTKFSKANFIVVDDTLLALQNIAAFHRNHFDIPVIGITGSNGKTIVKEWLQQLLHQNFNIIRSPKSYNSQVGVPLSVWELSANHNLAIFEAGISQENEMAFLQKIIRPTIGIFTFLGDAHNEGFKNNVAKAKEKFSLFFQAQEVVVCIDDSDVVEAIKTNNHQRYFTWSQQNSSANLYITNKKIAQNKTTLSAVYNNNAIEINIPFIDEASIANACTCWATMLLLGIKNEAIAPKMLQLQPVAMRLQMLAAINNCKLINDSYSNDIHSFYIALDYLVANAGNEKKTIILSDFPGIDPKNNIVYKSLINELTSKKIDRVIGIGNAISQCNNLFIDAKIEAILFENTQQFLGQKSICNFNNEYILVKGARVFEFEKICNWLQQKTHKTVLEINLTALVGNLKIYQSKIKSTTKLMAMVKAFSYGSGSVEVAKALQFHKIDYLAVAYADEGVELRKGGITLPIMVLNADENSFDDLVNYSLEPQVYSFTFLKILQQYILQQGLLNFAVHIKLNTGMNRLGFEVEKARELCHTLHQNKALKVVSVLSHLVASDASSFDSFTLIQQQKFDNFCTKIEDNLGYSFIKHIGNSAAITRLANLQYNMVRLGIGLYGVDSANELQLHTVATLKSTIAQIRTVKANETVGYNKNGVLTRDSKIATIRIGYADGVPRKLGNRVGNVFINGFLAPIIGNICMDMLMVDITDITTVFEGDEVEVFGKNILVTTVANQCNTIAYEILSTINQRVKRVYVEE
jgi:Alr-MurF fusion protein